MRAFQSGPTALTRPLELRKKLILDDRLAWFCSRSLLPDLVLPLSKLNRDFHWETKSLAGSSWVSIHRYLTTGRRSQALASCFAPAAVPSPVLSEQPLRASFDDSFPYILANLHHTHNLLRRTLLLRLLHDIGHLGPTGACHLCAHGSSEVSCGVRGQ